MWGQKSRGNTFDSDQSGSGERTTQMRRSRIDKRVESQALWVDSLLWDDPLDV